jgi:hypothetical protein
MNFAVNGVEVGTHESEVRMAAPGIVRVTLKVAAFLDELPEKRLDLASYDKAPYWNIERARVGDTRQVPLEIVVNGRAVEKKLVTADGRQQDLTFEIPIARSSWIAARILPSSHTNPIFVLVGNKPIRASRRSAEWCLAAVDQCWTQKAPKIAPVELADMRKLYDHAREEYKQRLAECDTP